MKTNYSKNQRGVVTVLVVMALPVLLLIMGLALDFGHVFVNKTRLQNALDATALSAAIVINADVSKDITAQNNASDEGIKTFEQFKKSMGNDELNEVILLRTDFKYFATLPTLPPLPPPLNATDKFAFVKVTSTKNVIPWLIGIMDDMPIPARATAGPVGNNCNLVPFVMCAMVNPSIDKNCDDDTIKIDAVSGHAVLGTDGINDCYGYNVGQLRSLMITCNGNNNNCPANSLESGNFNLLDLDGSQGGKDIRDILQGTTNTCLQGNTLNTKPGWTWGNVSKGVDDRFNSDTQTTEYPKSIDTKVKGVTVTTDITYNPSPYTQYEIGRYGNNKRVWSVPFADCTGLQNGNTNIPSVTTNGKPVAGCVFLTEDTNYPQPYKNDKKVMVEFTGKPCPQSGIWSPQNPVLNGPYKIVLFKSSGSGDS